MSKDLPNDGLEDFLKKSFDGFAEDPSDALWDHIEKAIPPSNPNAPSQKPGQKFWWPAGLAALVLCLLTCQHFYYSQRIEQLEKAFEKINIQKSEDASLKKDQASAPENALLPTQKAATNSSPEPLRPNPTAAAEIKRFPKNDAQPEYLGTNKHSRFSPSENKQLQASTSEELRQIEPLQDATAGEIAAAENTPAVMEAPVAEALNRGNTLKPLAPATLMPLQRFALSTPILVYTISPTTTSNKSQQNTLSLHAAMYKVTSAIERKEPNPMPGPMHAPEEKNTASGSSFYTGLGFDHQLNRHLGFHTGLDYVSTKLTAEHKTRLKFEDHNHMGGPSGHEYQFEYGLNTPSGIVEVSLRVSDTDSTTAIPDDEPVELSSTTHFNNRALSIPFLLTYQTRYKRWGLHLNGGILANFQLKNEVDLGQVRLVNTPKLKVEGFDPPPKPAQAPGLSFDYAMNASLSYRFTPGLQLSVGPSVLGNIPQVGIPDDISVRRRAWGLNANLSILF